MKRRLQVLALVLGAAACAAGAAGPPHLVEDQTACAHCTMLVSDRRYAAGFVENGESKIYDDIACLINGGSFAGQRIWFHDAGSGEWLQGRPVFVKSDQLRTPMAGGIAAFADPAAAGREASRVGGQVFDTFDEVAAIVRKGGSK